MSIEKSFLKELKEKASWEVGETSMHQFSAEERKFRLGYIPGPDELSLEERNRISKKSHIAFMAKQDVILYPPAFNWTNVAGHNFIGSVLDQGSCGSCVSFGTNTTVEGTLRVANKIPVGGGNDLPFLSEGQLFFCGGGSCKSGWFVSAALSYLQSTGVVPNSFYPYSDTAGQSCKLTGTFWKDIVTQISSSETISTTDNMKEWISEKGPLIATFSVYSDFFSYKSGVYKHTSGEYEGGHCISVVGYSDVLEAWLCQNSWGTGWGESGYFWIGYGQCGIDATMWGVNVPYTKSFIAGNYKILSDGKQTWKDTAAMTSLESSGKLYAVQNSYLYEITPSDGSYKILSDGKQTWKDTAAMTSLESTGKLYAVQNGYLYEITPSDGSYKILSDGKQTWTNTAGMTSLESTGKLYAVQNGYLYEITPSDGSYKILSDGKQTWTNTAGMTSLESPAKLYAVQNGHLYEVNPSDGAYKILSDGKQTWNDTASMTSMESTGKLYIVQKDHLYYVDREGNYAILNNGRATWSNTAAMSSLKGTEMCYAVQNSYLYSFNS